MGKEEQGVNAGCARYQVIPRVLCFVLRGDDILLLKGAPDKRLWAGKYNGVGGHVEREDVRAAAVREIREETGLDVSDVRLRGIVNIDTSDDAGVMLFVFTARAASTQLVPSREGSLEWFARDQLPSSDLVQDLPALLARISCDDGALFFARYTYDEQGRLMMAFAPD